MQAGWARDEAGFEQHFVAINAAINCKYLKYNYYQT
jgi:hypothetical protein